MSNIQLPDLHSTTPHPIRHQASCASLSLALLQLLNDVLPAPPSLTLSVGSGPGLIEALLLHHFPSRATLITLPLPQTELSSEDNHSDSNEDDIIQGSFYGVEVKNPKSVNRYLPQENVLTVTGTWALPAENILSRVEGLLFIYPRQTSLIRLYLERCTNLKTVVWIGPRCDEDEFTKPLREWGVRLGDERLTPASDGDTRAKLVEDGEIVAFYRRSVG
ncbi:hypothetical protein V8F20_011496 [Naviculisporaceae sp. PSN 640]